MNEHGTITGRMKGEGPNNMEEVPSPKDLKMGDFEADQPHPHMPAIGTEGRCELCGFGEHAYVHHMYVDESMPLPTDLPIGTDLVTMADQYMVARNERLKLDRKAAEMKKHEHVMRAAVIAKAKEAGQTVVGTKIGTVKVKPHQEPQADDWAGIRQYIIENDAWDIMHKSLTVTALRDRVAAGETIPGLGWKEVWKATVGKAE